MAEKIYIVTNNEGLKVRRKPDVNTGAVVRVMSNGEIFHVNDVFVLGLKVWARLTEGDGAEQEYACLAIGSREFAVLHDPNPEPGGEGIFGWPTAIDAWARSQGYNGPRP
jgi:hypothetical protein